MIYFGLILYLALFVLLLMFWLKVRDLSLDDLFARNARAHHRVQKVIRQHPLGGSWREYRRWRQEDD